MKKKKWTKLSEYCVTDGTWKVSKNFMDGCTLYAVWKNDEKQAAGYVNSFDEAKELIDQLEKWVEDYERGEKCSQTAALPVE